MSYSVGGETITHNRSVERQLRFYCATLEASRVLGGFYGVGQAQMADMFRAKSRYMANMAFRSRRRGLVGKVADTVGRWRLSVGIKTKIYLLLGRIL